MDSFMDDSGGERLIEDYLFSDYERPPYKSTFGLDQQFAKPIEDEDLFGDLQKSPNPEQDDDKLMLDDIDGELHERGNFARIGVHGDGKSVNTSCVGIFKEDEFRNQENQQDLSEFSLSKIKTIDVDEIFVNDYSDTSKDNNESGSVVKDYSSNVRGKTFDVGQNCTHTSVSNTSNQITPAQHKVIAMRQKIKEQALASGLIPKKLRPDEDGVIHIGNHDGSQSDISTRFMFSKFFNRSKKVRDPLKGGCGKVSWDEYKEALMKKICTDKRKIWDSFQAPCDNYDEDEELIEENAESFGEKDSDKGDDETDDEVDDDGALNDVEQDEMDEESSLNSDDARINSRSKRIMESDDDDYGQSSHGNFEDSEKDVGETIMSGDENVENDRSRPKESGSDVGVDNLEQDNRSRFQCKENNKMDDSYLNDEESDFNDDDDDQITI